tara:strand:- start:547 stop:846 length:300 start_codon:yes stop_codon:yes gene_type:complete
MEFWYFILFDLAFLALLGLLFYRFQKSRIIRSDKLDLISRLDSLIDNLPSEYAEPFRLNLETQSWETLKQDLENLPTEYQTRIEGFQSLIDDLDFFIKN